MDKIEILKKLDDIFKDILDDEKITLTENTRADDVEGWDSLTHVQLVVAVERYFKIRFTAKEIQGWKNVGELAESINSKI